ncbi:MAG TPA: substrate-binding domain-containing protein [Phycisphaerae bacterium]
MRLLKSVLTVLLAVTLASCGDSGSAGGGAAPAKAGEKIKIGFLVKQPDQSWFQNEWKFADQAAAKDGFEVIKIGTPDGPKTLAAIDSLAAQGAQGFIICTPEPKLGDAIVERANRDNLKVFSVDDRLETADGKAIESVPHMGITARDIGKLVGKTLADEAKKRAWKNEETAACIVTHDEGGQTHVDRTEGAAEALIAAGFPKDRIFKIAQKEPAGLATGRDAMNAVLTQHADVKNWLVAAINDDTVVGAIRATENRGLTADHVAGVGIGVDSSIPDLSAPQPTGLLATVLISPRRHGYETAELMYKWIKDGAEPPKTTWTQGILIDRANFQKVMEEQGLK